MSVTRRSRLEEEAAFFRLSSCGHRYRRAPAGASPALYRPTASTGAFSLLHAVTCTLLLVPTSFYRSVPWIMVVMRHGHLNYLVKIV